MTVLVGGMRVLNANWDGSKHGVFTEPAGAADQRLLRQPARHGTKWQAADENQDVFDGYDRKTGEKKWTGSRVDLIFGSHSELRALCEVYGSDDGEEKFVQDFVAAWNKVMNLDRYDVKTA